ncbi:MAG: hypothetical protein AAFP77_22720 [Bacteroidota bacterium]
MKQILDDDFLEELTNSKRKSKWFYVSTVFLILGFVLATILSWWEVETIMGSGPVVSIIGIIHLLISRKSKERINMFLGALPLVLSVAWFIIINAFNLSPRDCQYIVPASGAIATLLVSILGFVALSVRWREPKQE